MVVNVLSMRISLSYQVNVLRFHMLWKKINRYWLGNLRIEDQLADFVWVKDPSVVFLAET